MPKRLTLEESYEVAFENEREASAWALKSLARHLFLIEEALFQECAARELAESRALFLERRLLGREPPAPAASGVQLKAEGLPAPQEAAGVVVVRKDGTVQKL